MRTFIFFASLLCSLSILVAPKAIAQVKDQKIVSHLPAVLPQKRTPWCFAFAARSVLSQHLCAKKGQCQKAEEMAVSNFIHSYVEANPFKKLSETVGFQNPMAGREWWTGGDSAIALKYMTENKSPIVQFQCTNEKQMFEYADLVPFFSAGFLLESVLNTYKEQKEKNPELKADAYIRASVPQQEVLEKVLWFAPLLDTSKDFEDFTKKILMPAKCASNRVPTTPQFNVRDIMAKNANEIEKTIDAALAKDALVGLSMCAGTIDPSVGECGPHATAVGGSRQFCNEGKCEKQYLFLDSSFFADAPRNSDGSSWVAASLIVSAVRAYADMVSAPGKGMQGALDEMIRLRETTAAKYQEFKGQFSGMMAATLSKIQTDLDAALLEQKKLILSNPHVPADQKVQLLKQAQESFWKSRDDLERQIRQSMNPEKLLKSLEPMEKTIEKLDQQIETFRNFKFSNGNIFWLE